MYAINRENLITTVCYSFSTADCFLETEEDLNPSVHPRYCQWNKPNDSGRGSQHADSPTKQDQMAVHTHTHCSRKSSSVPGEQRLLNHTLEPLAPLSERTRKKMWSIVTRPAGRYTGPDEDCHLHHTDCNFEQSSNGKNCSESRQANDKEEDWPEQTFDDIMSARPAYERDQPAWLVSWHRDILRHRDTCSLLSY